MRRIVALLAAGVSLPALAAEPDPVTLPEVVVTATRVPTLVEKIPAGVSVIDRKAIEANDYETLTQALAALPGVRVSPSGGPGGQASVFVRGSNSNHVLVLRDGMPINDPTEASGAFNFGVDTLADVERIEVIRGPMAALYGSGAIGGVINLISRRGSVPGIHFSGDLAGGYPAAIRGSAVASGIEGPVDFALSAESQSMRGYDAIPQRMSIHTGTPQGFRDRIATLNLGYTPIEGTRLSLFLRARQSLFRFNELGFPTFDSANSSGEATSLLGRAGITSQLFGGTLETGLFVGRLQEDRHYLEPFDPRDPNQAIVDDRYHAYRTDVQWNNTLHLSDWLRSPLLSESDLTFGYQHTADRAKLRVNTASFGLPFRQGADATLTADGVYAGLQTAVGQRVTLTGQARQDWTGPNAPTTWRVGGVVDMTELATRFKAAYGTAFRSPSLFDRFGVDSFGYVGNPNLKPERARGWEAGFVTTLPGLGRPDLVSVGATYFNQRIRDLITAVFVPVDTAVNIGAARIQGVETELTLHPARWATLRATWTFTDAQNADDGSRLLRRPQHAGSLDAILTPLPGLSIAPELLYTGAFRDFLNDNNGFGTANGTTQHGLIANLAVSYDVDPRIQLFASGRNLFYSRFEAVNGFQIPGPTVLAGVRVRL